MACLLYGALNLDEQQFGQVYGVLQTYQEEFKQKGLSWTNAATGDPAAMNQMIAQAKAEVQTRLATVLTPEQAGILAGILPSIQVEPGKLGFTFGF